MFFYTCFCAFYIFSNQVNIISVFFFFITTLRLNPQLISFQVNFSRGHNISDYFNLPYMMIYKWWLKHFLPFLPPPATIFLIPLYSSLWPNFNSSNYLILLPYVGRKYFILFSTLIGQLRNLTSNANFIIAYVVNKIFLVSNEVMILFSHYLVSNINFHYTPVICI